MQLHVKFKVALLGRYTGIILSVATAALLSACGGSGVESPVIALTPIFLNAQASTDKALRSAPSFAGTAIVPADQAKPIIDAFMASSTAAFSIDGAGGPFNGKPLRNLATRPISEDSRDLFNWAQGAHRALFPTNEPDRVVTPYEFRFYPSTGNHVGVANGRVYTLGPMNNGALVDHGTVESFACLFKPDRCASPGMLTNIPTPTYPAGSDAFSAFNYVNQERSRCGFGMMAQNTILDMASQGHLSYIAQNGGRVGWTHVQIPGRPGFTGALPMDRVRSLGYGVPGRSTASEVSTTKTLLNAGVNGNGIAVDRVRALFNAPYHALGLLAPQKEVGLAYGFIGQEVINSQNTLISSGLILNPGFADTTIANFQQLGAAVVRTYPCEGSANIERQLLNESPNPVTPRNLATHPIGSSIVIKTRSTSVLLITSASMQNTATAGFVGLLPVLTRANDPNLPSSLTSGDAIIMPNAPLEPLTQYAVAIAGTNNGVYFERRFRFTTSKDFIAGLQ